MNLRLAVTIFVFLMLDLVGLCSRWLDLVIGCCAVWTFALVLSAGGLVGKWIGAVR
jgi:hypothetical protein